MSEKCYQDIFYEYDIKPQQIVDITSDEGVWQYIEALSRGIPVQYSFNSGTANEPRSIRDEIKNSSMIYVYGAGSSGIRTYKLLKNYGIEISGFIDSSGEKQGTLLFNKRIYEITEVKRGSCIILSCGAYKDVIKNIKNVISLEEYEFYVDYANSLFYSKEPLAHVQLYDFGESGYDE